MYKPSDNLNLARESTTVSLQPLQARMEDAPVRANERKPRLRIASHTGFELFDLDHVAYCEAESSLTRFYFTDGRKALSSHHLGYYEDILAGFDFCRIHHKYLVNIAAVVRYTNTDHTVALANGVELPVAQQRLKGFLALVEDRCI